jgi:hypothetical protein
MIALKSSSATDETSPSSIDSNSYRLFPFSDCGCRKPTVWAIYDVIDISYIESASIGKTGQFAITIQCSRVVG